MHSVFAMFENLADMAVWNTVPKPMVEKEMNLCHEATFLAAG
jgi:hypothetical protein